MPIKANTRDIGSPNLLARPAASCCLARRPRRPRLGPTGCRDRRPLALLPPRTGRRTSIGAYALSRRGRARARSRSSRTRPRSRKPEGDGDVEPLAAERERHAIRRDEQHPAAHRQHGERQGLRERTMRPRSAGRSCWFKARNAGLTWLRSAATFRLAPATQPSCTRPAPGYGLCKIVDALSSRTAIKPPHRSARTQPNRRAPRS